MDITEILKGNYHETFLCRGYTYMNDSAKYNMSISDIIKLPNTHTRWVKSGGKSLQAYIYKIKKSTIICVNVNENGNLTRCDFYVKEN
jgi:hypothetical protein